VALRSKLIEEYLDTIWEICHSKYVTQYVIGFTSRSAKERRQEYRKGKINHLVVVADKLTQRDALDIESAIQQKAVKDKRSALYQKYHDKKRDGRLYMSHGSSKKGSIAKAHSVYMAWWD
jgi:hypothetical protein